MSTYIDDARRISEPMGQFQLWFNKLFYYSGERLGWRYLRGSAWQASPSSSPGLSP